MRQERHAGRHYSAAFSRTLVAFTRKIQRAEEASVSGQVTTRAVDTPRVKRVLPKLGWTWKEDLDGPDAR